MSKLPPPCPVEIFEPLLDARGLRLERIVSAGQATPEGEWLVQDWDEWVVLLAGEARLLIEGESDPRTMQPGDWINLPAGVQHRVESTSKDPPTIWLALHYHRYCRSENRTHPPCRVQPSSQAGTE